MYEFLLLHVFLDIWYCCHLEFSSSNECTAIDFPWTPSRSLLSSKKDGRPTNKYIQSQSVKNSRREKHGVLWGNMTGVTWFSLKEKTLFRDPGRETETQAKVLAVKVKFKADLRGIFWGVQYTCASYHVLMTNFTSLSRWFKWHSFICFQKNLDYWSMHAFLSSTPWTMLLLSLERPQHFSGGEFLCKTQATYSEGASRGTVVENLPANAIPGSGRSPGGNGNPLQFSCLENPIRQRGLVGYSPWSLKELSTEHACMQLIQDGYPFY